MPRLSLVPLTQRDHLLFFPVWFQVLLLFRATNCQSFLQLTFLLLSGNGIAERFWKPTLGASMQINPCFLCAYFTWTLTVPASTRWGLSFTPKWAFTSVGVRSWMGGWLSSFFSWHSSVGVASALVSSHISCRFILAFFLPTVLLPLCLVQVQRNPHLS